MSYQFGFFFDPGSGTCLWARNEAAKERFGDAVDHWTLPISENLKRQLQYLVAWFDTSIDWSSPGDSDDTWSKDELVRFKSECARALKALRSELAAEKYNFYYEGDA